MNYSTQTELHNLHIKDPGTIRHEGSSPGRTHLGTPQKCNPLARGLYRHRTGTEQSSDTRLNQTNTRALISLTHTHTHHTPAHTHTHTHIIKVKSTTLTTSALLHQLNKHSPTWPSGPNNEVLSSRPGRRPRQESSSQPTPKGGPSR